MKVIDSRRRLVVTPTRLARRLLPPWQAGLGEARFTDLIDDRRLAETIYRVALADGIMDRVTYQDPPEDAS
jgi:hypothetical protein